MDPIDVAVLIERDDGIVVHFGELAVPRMQKAHTSEDAQVAKKHPGRVGRIPEVFLGLDELAATIRPIDRLLYPGQFVRRMFQQPAALAKVFPQARPDVFQLQRKVWVGEDVFVLHDERQWVVVAVTGPNERKPVPKDAFCDGGDLLVCKDETPVQPFIFANEDVVLQVLKDTVDHVRLQGCHHPFRHFLSKCAAGFLQMHAIKINVSLPVNSFEMEDCWLCIFDYLGFQDLVRLGATSRDLRALCARVKRVKALKRVRKFRWKLNAGARVSPNIRAAIDLVLDDEGSWSGDVGEISISGASCFWAPALSSLISLGTGCFSQELHRAGGDLVDKAIIIGTGIRKIEWAADTREWFTSHHLGSRIAVSTPHIPFPELASAHSWATLRIWATSVSSVFARQVCCRSALRLRLTEPFLVPHPGKTFSFSWGFINVYVGDSRFGVYVGS